MLSEYHHNTAGTDITCFVHRFSRFCMITDSKCLSILLSNWKGNR